VTTATAVPAIIPLSLLEAIRNLDTPVEDGLEELAEEIVVRRLGLSPTVAAQIQRYHQAADRDVGIDQDEVVSVLRLVGRRPDAPLVFADAGRRAARYAARSGGPARTLARVSPAGVGRRIALRAAARLSRDVFGGDLKAKSQGSEVSMRDPLSILALPDGAACAFFGSAYGELLRSLTAFEGAMLHEQCRSRGGEACVWTSAPAELYE
jgi:hypothetical protein